jgi:hypothetical protein
MSNLKLPDIDGKETFRPMRSQEPIENSSSLKYDKFKAFHQHKEEQKAHNESELD